MGRNMKAQFHENLNPHYELSAFKLIGYWFPFFVCSHLLQHGLNSEQGLNRVFTTYQQYNIGQGAVHLCVPSFLPRGSRKLVCLMNSVI